MHPFWDNFGIRNEKLKKKLGYYEIESIENTCQIVLAINPKEYYEKFRDLNANKKHKRMKKGSSEMEFENFANSKKFDYRKIEKQEQ